MKLFKTLLTILFISLLSSPSWSEEMGDLVEREGLYYKKFTDVPFTGEIIRGRKQGSFKNGVKDGAWVSYWSSGQLESKVNFKNGKKEGAWVRYYYDGQIHWKGNLKNSKQEGPWVYYREDGTVLKEWTGTYKNGVKISD